MAFYKIADTIVEYEPIYPLLAGQMQPYLCETAQKADVTLSVTPSFCAERQRENPHLTEEQCEYIFAGSEFYRKLILRGGFFLHASAVEVDGKAYLFSARSGTGKSTHTKLWQKYFGSDRALIINDDKPVIKIEEETCVVYGTPFSGKTDENLNRRVSLQAVCMLERGEKNQIRRIEAGEAIPLILQQTMLPKNQKLIDALFPMIETVLRKVPIYRMQCNISEEAAILAYRAMRGAEE